ALPCRSSGRRSSRRGGWCRTWCNTSALRSFRVLRERAVGVDDVAVEVPGRPARPRRLFMQSAFEAGVLSHAADCVAGALAHLVGQALVLQPVAPAVGSRHGFDVLRSETVAPFRILVVVRG